MAPGGKLRGWSLFAFSFHDRRIGPFRQPSLWLIASLKRKAVGSPASRRFAPGSATTKELRPGRASCSTFSRPGRPMLPDSSLSSKRAARACAPPWRPRARRSGPTFRASDRLGVPARSASARPAPTPHQDQAAVAPAKGSKACSPRLPTAAPRRAPQPSRSARRCRPAPFVRRASGRPRRLPQRSPTACVRPLRSRSSSSPPIAVGGDRRADRPQSRRKPRSYQVTLDGLGRRRRHNTGWSALGTTFGIESAAAARVCASYRTQPLNENDIEFRSVACRERVMISMCSWRGEACQVGGTGES